MGHIVIESWMISELGLRGNELIAYAIISGCSFAENQEYTASISYFCEWTDLDRAGVLRLLSGLEEKGLIQKRVTTKKGKEYNSYKALKPQVSTKNYEVPEEPIEEEEEPEKIPYKDIIEYLNRRLGTRFKYQADYVKRCIRARWNEGFTLEDFFTVTEGCIQLWGKDNRMNKYLRPQTIYGTKMDSYLQVALKNDIHPVPFNPPDEDDSPVLDQDGNPVVY